MIINIFAPNYIFIKTYITFLISEAKKLAENKVKEATSFFKSFF
jgi:hypothetical protein